jgi:hypothetical protein
MDTARCGNLYFHRGVGYSFGRAVVQVYPDERAVLASAQRYSMTTGAHIDGYAYVLAARVLPYRAITVPRIDNMRCAENITALANNVMIYLRAASTAHAHRGFKFEQAQRFLRDLEVLLDAPVPPFADDDSLVAWLKSLGAVSQAPDPAKLLKARALSALEG